MQRVFRPKTIGAVIERLRKPILMQIETTARANKRKVKVLRPKKVAATHG